MADERMTPEERQREEERRFEERRAYEEGRGYEEDRELHEDRPLTGESPPSTAEAGRIERERAYEVGEERERPYEAPEERGRREARAREGMPAEPTDPERARGAPFRFERFESGRSRFVSGVFDKPEDAERAAQHLTERGFPNEEIVVFLSKEAGDEYVSARQVYQDHEGHTYISKRKVPLEEKNKALEGTGTGAAIGGGLGAVAAAIAAVGTSLAIPPLGIIVAGPVAAALAGAGAGGLAGGLIGALVGAGMSEYRAKEIDERLRKGGVVLGVSARNETEVERLEEALSGYGAEVVREAEDR